MLKIRTESEVKKILKERKDHIERLSKRLYQCELKNYMESKDFPYQLQNFLQDFENNYSIIFTDDDCPDSSEMIIFEISSDLFDEIVKHSEVINYESISKNKEYYDTSYTVNIFHGYAESENIDEDNRDQINYLTIYATDRNTDEEKRFIIISKNYFKIFE